LLIIPGAYLSLVISLFYPLIVIEKFNNSLVGFKHFCQFIWGNWWRCVVVVFIPMILCWLVAYAVYLGIIHLGIGAHFGMLENGLQTFFSAIYLPIAAGIFIIQLNDLRLRRQQKLAGAPPTTS
jgi:hypothetical protein